MLFHVFKLYTYTHCYCGAILDSIMICGLYIGLKMTERSDYNLTIFGIQQAAEALGLSTQSLRKIEGDLPFVIPRIDRGSVAARSYPLPVLFEIARWRRENKLGKLFSRSIILSTYVLKSGTAKTTTTCNVAIQLALMGLKVLLVDNDPQADLTSMLGYDPDATADELIEMGLPSDMAVDGHIGNLLSGHDGVRSIFQKMDLEKVIKKPLGEYGPHLIPSEVSLDDLDTVLHGAQGGDFRYQWFLRAAREGKVANCDLSSYDVIMIDNAPSGSLLSRNAITCADVIVCPIRMDKFSFRALSRLSEQIKPLGVKFNIHQEIVAIPTMFQRNRPRLQANLARLMGVFPGKVTENLLYFSEDYLKSLEQGVPTLLWKNANDATLASLRGVTNEIVSRVQPFLLENK